MGLVAYIAEQAGATEPALKLILGQLAGYPILLLHRRLLRDKSALVQHLYFMLTGLLIGQWVIGPDIAHNLYCVLATYILLLVAGGTLLSVVLSFVFNMGYLLAGYWYISGDEYNISWTMPHCVLTLRLIGLTFDCYDGARAKDKDVQLSKDQEKSALSDAPSILEMLSHTFFVGGYLVGPQFSMKKFREFVKPEFHKDLPSPIAFGVKRLGIGICYITAHVVISMYLPEMWPMMDSYMAKPLLVKLLLLPIWVKGILCKYLGVWLMAEGVCVVSGLGYNGKSADGAVDWTGCANVKLRRFESATSFGHIIESFNINTNAWAAAYIYKRLKFLNNRNISQGATLGFLAIWHGWHSGYIVTFFNEFIVMNLEKQFLGWWGRSDKAKHWMEHPAYNSVTSIIGWVYVVFFLPHCFFAFAMLQYPRYIVAYKSVYFLEYLFFLTWPAWGKAVKAILAPKTIHRD